MDEQLRIILIIIVSVSIFGLLVFVYVKNYIRNKINQLVEEQKKQKKLVLGLVQWPLVLLFGFVFCFFLPFLYFVFWWFRFFNKMNRSNRINIKSSKRCCWKTRWNTSKKDSGPRNKRSWLSQWCSDLALLFGFAFGFFAVVFVPFFYHFLSLSLHSHCLYLWNFLSLSIPTNFEVCLSIPPWNRWSYSTYKT